MIFFSCQQSCETDVTMARETFIIGFTDSGKFCGKQMGNPGVARINVTITTSSLPLRMFNTAEGGFLGVTNTAAELEKFRS